jgi:hypothetical protein
MLDMTKNITLAVDEAILDRVRVIAAEQKTTVNAMVRDYLSSVAGDVRSSARTDNRSPVHERMKQTLAQGRARYESADAFDREYANDRDLQRAEMYFKNRQDLLDLIDRGDGDMGSQKWNREALYDR